MFISLNVRTGAYQGGELVTARARECAQGKPEPCSFLPHLMIVYSQIEELQVQVRLGP